jgi:HPr kinase/phosphorylase
VNGPGAQARLHATTVAVEQGGAWGALVISGRSGAGKSELALQLMALGATLVADDQTLLAQSADGAVLADVPDPLRGLIEMRGIGLLPVPYRAPVAVCACLDMDQREADRLPPARTRRLLDCDVALLLHVDSPAFPAALLHYMRQQVAMMPERT